VTDYKPLLGGAATAIALIGYAPYIYNTLKGKTKPHAFSWFVWGVLEAIGFTAQVVGHAGPGAWVTGFSSAVTFFIFFLALKNGNRKFLLFDWISLGGALIAIILWRLTNDPTLAVIFVVTADATAFFPTYRKAFSRPFEETLTEFALSFVKHSIAIFALSTYSLTTWLYPASLMATNGAFVIMTLIRRRAMKAVS
jgi:hypothetical protein